MVARTGLRGDSHGERWHIQRAALSIFSIGNVQMRPMKALGITGANAVGIATAAGGLGKTALDHDLSGAQESLDEPLLLKHSLILRYACLKSPSREKPHEPAKMFRGPFCTMLQRPVVAAVGSKRFSSSILRRKVA